jgi:hypothetical protein
MNIMKTIQEKEEMFNRFLNGEMDKREMSKLVKRLLLDKELREYFTVQIEFITILNDSQLSVKY